MDIKPWKVKNSKYLMKERWLTVRADVCEMSNGHVLDPYYVFEYTDWAHIVAFNSNKEVLIVHQYRHGIKRICYELPGGVLEAGEEPIIGAKRELLEETGFTSNKFEPLTHFAVNPSTHNNLFHAFVALDVEDTGSRNLDPSEEIGYEFVPIDDALKMITDGRFFQGLHIATLLMALKKYGLL